MTESEVWVPEGLTFSVGDRVQILPRPECYYCRSAEGEDGLVGTIEHIGERSHRLRSEAVEPGERAHIYWVAFPDEIPSSGTHHSHFAITELLPLADADGDA
jgi:hypothetical protein